MFQIRYNINGILLLLEKPQHLDPCNPSPCGPNAICNNGECTCLSEYHGDPYFGCRPECVLSTDCPNDKACLRSKCVDPCINMCGLNADCNVYNHIAVCSCPIGMTGDAFTQCLTVESMYYFLTQYNIIKLLFY